MQSACADAIVMARLLRSASDTDAIRNSSDAQPANTITYIGHY
jgi:hypothetical protein